MFDSDCTIQSYIDEVICNVNEKTRGHDRDTGYTDNTGPVILPVALLRSTDLLADARKSGGPSARARGNGSRVWLAPVRIRYVDLYPGALMTRVLTAILLALSMVGHLSASAGAAPVRAAYMYCDWPDGSAAFKDEFDQAFAALGWQVTKFENKQAKELSEQLGNFDIVVGGGVSNYSNTQDFQPYAAQWQAFLQGGGVVVATDASYGAINSSWIGGLDPAFRTTAHCAALTRGPARKRRRFNSPPVTRC